MWIQRSQKWTNLVVCICSVLCREVLFVKIIDRAHTEPQKSCFFLMNITLKLSDEFQY